MECSNCHSSDLREDFGRGDVVCMRCGCVADNIVAAGLSYRECRDAYGVCTAYMAPAMARGQAFHGVFKGKSVPYQRRTYFNEKLAQFRQMEPEIPYKHETAICDAWTRYAPIWWGAAALDEIPDKERIRAVLAFIDQQREDDGKKRRFIRVYLERWRTIRYWFSAVKSTGCYLTDETVHRLRHMFIDVERAFDAIVAERDIGRASFINYDFVLRRLLELVGCTFAITDLHPLKTPNKQGRLILWWLEICRRLEWPYVNSDVRVFSDITFYEPRT